MRSYERGNKTKASIDEASSKIHDLSLKDNAHKEFRLSLTTSGYDFEANKPTYSNLKRQSFILGHSKTATAQKALQTLIDKSQKSQNLTLQDLENAFSQEPVSKEFYESYKRHYEIICAKLQSANLAHIFANYKGIATHKKAIESFTKKLLGRIVFLYFLQKKGWLGVSRDKSYGQGDTNFLHNLFVKAAQENANFYSAYLCPLFFDSLNSQKQDDYSALFDCKIPFLNGGLFEDEFSDKFSPSLAEGDKGGGYQPTLKSPVPSKAHFLIAQVFDNATF